MNKIQEIFKNKKVVIKNLIPYGFKLINDIYEYNTILSGCNFLFIFQITKKGIIQTKIIDCELNEEYTLHLSNAASGNFVSMVRSQYEDILSDICQKCFEDNIFKNKQTKEIIEYVRKKFDDELEFLWKNSDNAIWRRKDNKKWYAAIITVSKRKLGLNSDETVEIIDLRLKPELMNALIDHIHYFPGWHMNKKHWYTMILDDSVSTEEICKRINESYLLAKK